MYGVTSGKSVGGAGGRGHGTARGRGRAREIAGDDAAAMAEAFTQQIVDMVTERLATRTAAQADKMAEKIATKTAAHAEKLARKASRYDSFASHADALDVWLRAERASRRPRFTRDDLAAVAIAVADAEGVDAVSMRRLATELGAGTMTLYHYVRTKDELMTLVHDAVMGEMIVPEGDDLPADWRAAMKLIATRSRDVVLRHPWLLDVADDPPIGPNSVRHFDQSMHAVESYPGSFEERLDLVRSVDEYTIGFCFQARSNLHEELAGHHLVEYLDDLVGSGDYPHLRAMLEDQDMGTLLQAIYDHGRDHDRFERNLDRLLDGFT
jgi:AcrR family transcriptional regulator